MPTYDLYFPRTYSAWRPRRAGAPFTAASVLGVVSLVRWRQLPSPPLTAGSLPATILAGCGRLNIVAPRVPLMSGRCHFPW